MKILVISDTHRDFSAIELALSQNKDADMLIHLGDGETEFEDFTAAYPLLPAVYVGGNCDIGMHETTHVVRTGCGINIFCCHGHTLAVKMTLGLLTKNARENSCDIALYGHTHIPFNDIVNGVYVMNPGSAALPRGDMKPSYGIIEIDKNRAISINIRELRGK